MKPKASDGRIENQRVTGLLTDLITATGFCEPINSLYFSSQSVETFTCNRVLCDSYGQFPGMSYTVCRKPLNSASLSGDKILGENRLGILNSGWLTHKYIS